MVPFAVPAVLKGLFSAKTLMSPKTWGIGIAVILALVLGLKVWSFVDRAFEDRQKVIEQTVVIERQADEIKTLEAVQDQIKSARKIAKEAKKDADEAEAELKNIRDKALTAGEDKDGTIAPVLGDTLRDLRNRVRQ